MFRRLGWRRTERKGSCGHRRGALISSGQRLLGSSSCELTILTSSSSRLTAGNLHSEPDACCLSLIILDTQPPVVLEEGQTRMEEIVLSVTLRAILNLKDFFFHQQQVCCTQKKIYLGCDDSRSINLNNIC